MVKPGKGKVIYRRQVSSRLQIVRLAPEAGAVFPGYTAGQHIFLVRNDCRLLVRRRLPDGSYAYEYQKDARGEFLREAVTRTFSVASAPWETREHGYLEFFVTLEPFEADVPGKISEPLFAEDADSENVMLYENAIRGSFTLAAQAKGFRNVVMVGTGTGIAPFVSMVKQLHHDCISGSMPDHRVLLIHGNRTPAELGYLDELQAIERQQLFDFAYVPAVSRPGDRRNIQPSIGIGRVSNLLRSILTPDAMTPEHRNNPSSLVQNNPPSAEAVLPEHHTVSALRGRFISSETIILVCGNPDVIREVGSIARSQRIACAHEN